MESFVLRRIVSRWWVAGYCWGRRPASCWVEVSDSSLVNSPCVRFRLGAADGMVCVSAFVCPSVSERSKPYLPARGFQETRTLMQNRKLCLGLPTASPGPFGLPRRASLSRARRFGSLGLVESQLSLHSLCRLRPQPAAQGREQADLEVFRDF
jgi:hypothetical protein